MHFRFLHVFPQLSSSFLFRVEYYSMVWMDHHLLTHSPTEGQLGCLQLLATVSKAATNIHVQALVWI